MLQITHEAAVRAAQVGYFVRHLAFLVEVQLGGQTIEAIAYDSAQIVVLTAELGADL